jgi:hypothetical protein
VLEIPSEYRRHTLYLCRSYVRGVRIRFRDKNVRTARCTNLFNGLIKRMIKSGASIPHWANSEVHLTTSQLGVNVQDVPTFRRHVRGTQCYKELSYSMFPV